MLFQGGARSIHTAARYGHVGIINTLLQKGEKVDVTTNVSGEVNHTHLLSLFYFCAIELMRRIVLTRTNARHRPFPKCRRHQQHVKSPRLKGM